MIQLAPAMPAMDAANLVWTCIVHDFETGAFTLAPKILPIGALLAGSREGDSVGCFWPEDLNCSKWLDQQPPKSVIHVAFGSFTIFDKTQFQELALELELSCRPFLCVVRPDITTYTNAYPEGFQERLANRGQMVGWAPQQKVLSHPSIACFLSHCGWNSTMEGVANGAPFLCRPYFADQFLNESYITEVWKVGLKFNRSESGIITREEIKNKEEQVLSGENIVARASEFKERAMKSAGEGGQSSKNFNNFIGWMKA
ncbi:UDP-glycosyltransferase 83A1-like [Hevea brasiliensis]|uniref:UDP-glycosyltransferase 83A1-like n=1 Tax=Hevea brasiliensis TaxID=3981 RepID=UPI0025F16189|nr:UDP-glycosyltransferase 83A1-like [Hevea brasiliensis]